MLDKLKSLWTRWKVHVSVVGGVLVIATAYGTCSYEPPTLSEAEVVPVSTTVTPTVEVSDPTTVTGTTNTTNGATATTTTE